MLEFLYPSGNHYSKHHSQIVEACASHNWDIQCGELNQLYIRLHSARLPDLEALRTLLILMGTYEVGDMFATNDYFHFWSKKK